MSIAIFHFTDKQNEENYIANSDVKTVLFLNEVLQSLRIGPFSFIIRVLYNYVTCFLPKAPCFTQLILNLLKLFAQGDIIL